MSARWPGHGEEWRTRSVGFQRLRMLESEAAVVGEVRLLLRFQIAGKSLGIDRGESWFEEGCADAPTPHHRVRDEEHEVPVLVTGVGFVQSQHVAQPRHQDRWPRDHGTK